MGVSRRPAPGRGPGAGRVRTCPRGAPVSGRDERDGEGAQSPSPVAGLGLGEAATARTGEDARRRGWFWHWNSIVTQYSPLLGLKGVGLLNSYTVWTDRREESPHRGYAFPSQQSEADFYGEDRAELIAINKILVALDLIEIRKEMVLRTDPQGRRWRVPHNFYRVKDHGDGFSLTERDVLRVAELADRDKAVYRHVRRVFSPRFSPIDGDNVWHRILPELRRTELWQRLAARAAGEEGRASARTRAGHAARRAAANDAPPGFVVPIRGDATAPEETPNDTVAVVDSESETTSVANTNRGSMPSVDQTNDGWDAPETTSVEPANGGGATAVGPSNTTYNDPTLTTTTTRRREQNGGSRHGSSRPAASVDRDPTGLSTHLVESVTAGDAPEPGAADSAGRQVANGPGMPPADAPGEAAAIRAFEAANDRPATPAERTLLRGIAERFAPAAAGAGRADPAVPGSGWGWVGAAVYEAVEAGSAFVAPRRLREILGRWERDGFPVDGNGGRRSEVGGGRTSEGARSNGPRAGQGASAAPGRSSDLRPATSDLLAAGPDPLLPHGHGGRRTWAFAVGLLGEVLDRETLTGLVAGTAIVGYRDGVVTIAAPEATQAERLATTHRDLVGRKLSEAMRRPVRLVVVTEPGEGSGEPGKGRGAGAAASGADGGVGGEDGGAESVAASFPVAECGLASGRVWSAVLAELAADGEVGRANFDAWLRSATLVGRAGEGGVGSALVVGVPHVLARRRVADRFLPAVRRAVATVVGAPLGVEVVVEREWLASAASRGADGIERREGA